MGSPTYSRSPTSHLPHLCHHHRHRQTPRSNSRMPVEWLPFLSKYSPCRYLTVVYCHIAFGSTIAVEVKGNMAVLTSKLDSGYSG